jgi:hypothetical protein
VLIREAAVLLPMHILDILFSLNSMIYYLA